jgi:hypothetical protein
MKSFLFSICILCSSCFGSRYISAPTTFNTPFVKGAGELNVSANISTSSSETQQSEDSIGSATGFDFAASYSVSRHVYVFASHSFRHENDFPNSSFNLYDKAAIKYSRYHTDLGAGYFIQMNKADSTPAFFNVNAGLGLGSVYWRERTIYNNINASRFWSADVTRFTIEMAFQVHGKKHLRFAYINRFLQCFMSRIRTDYSDQQKEELFLKHPERRSFFESGFTLGYAFIKIPLMISWQLSLAGGKFNATRGAYSGLGVSYTMKKIKH